MNKIVSIIPLIFLWQISSGLLIASNTETEDKPLNLIFILVDDAGWTALGIYGSDLHETPNLDRFAQESLKFTNAYTASSICSPVRASIMTGKHPAKLNYTTWYEDSGPPRSNDQYMLLPPETIGNLPLEEFSLGEIFKKAGYFTAHVGKWHLGDTVHYPEAHGFDMNIGGNKWGMPHTYWFPFSGWRAIDDEYRYVPGLLDLNADNEGTYLTDRLTDEALKIIEARKDEPFYLQMSYYTPHVPLDGKTEFVDYYKEKTGADMIHQNPDYAAMIASMDENIGRIFQKVEETGISDQTVIIFYSDNGGLASSRVNVNNNHPLRSGKGSLYEGGIRVPLIIKWPGITGSGTVSDTPVSSMDFYPTFLELLGLEGDEEHNAEIDGLSIAPVLKDPSYALDREALYWHQPHYYPISTTPASAVRKEKWKLIHYFENNKLELYNLDEDTSESRNVADFYPQKVQKLYKELVKWRKDINAQIPSPNPDYRPEFWN